MKPQPMTITFNVLYVPGTVALLKAFPGSLLRWSSSYRFRLIANGCPPEERRLLEQLAASDPRLEYLHLASSEVVPHGVALSRLQEMEGSGAFAFIDSDVFATGPWQGAVEEGLAQRDAVFSCPPVWSDRDLETMPLDFVILGGCYQHLADGRCLGNSYFGIYDNRRLQQTIDRYGVGFEKRHWDQVPRRLRKLVRQLGLRTRIFDTGRLLNLLLGLDGGDLAHLPLPQLGHVGGVSGLGLARDRAARLSLPSRLRRRLTATLRRASRGWSSISAAERELLRRKSLRRRATVAFFSTLLRDLAEERWESPGLTLDDPQLEARVRAAEAAILTLFRDPEAVPLGLKAAGAG